MHAAIQHFGEQLEHLESNSAKPSVSTFARSNIIARTSGSASGAPTPHA
jgi:hypothetical protein